MKGFVYFSLIVLLLGCVKQVKPTIDTTEPVFIEEDTTTYTPVEIVKDTVPRITEVQPVQPEPPKIEIPQYVYRIQVGAFSVADNANRLKEEISQKVNVTVLVKYEGGFYKVRVGEFYTRDDAENFLNKLRNLGYTGIIREEKK